MAIEVVRLLTSTVTFPEFHPLAGESGAVFAFLVRHPEGAVLVDTGVGVGNRFIDKQYRPEHVPLLEQLERAGVGPGNVRCVVNTHLHFDHSGQNGLFPGTPIFVQAAAWPLVETEGFTIREWVRFEGERYELVDGEAEILPGVRVVPLPGHTAGHQGVVVDAVDGLTVIAGQVPYDVAEFEEICGRGEVPGRREGDPEWFTEEYLGSVRRIVEMQPARVVFSHDAREWRAEGR